MIKQTTLSLCAVISALALSVPAPAVADDLLVEACKRAVGHWRFSGNVQTLAVQDFSNLKPPRVKLKINDLLSSTFTCKFTSTAKPLGLKELCTELDCSKAGDNRFDEVAELLRRDGY